MSIFEKLKQARKPKEEPKKEEKKEEENKEAISEAELTKRLKGFLYSEDLVSEYIHIFRKLYEVPEFKQVMEIIEAKEQELNSINQAADEYFKQETQPNDEPPSDTEDNDNEDYLMTILNERYGE